MTDRLVEFLFAITGILLPPVLIALVALTALTLWMLGGLAREALDRARAQSAWRRFLARLEAGHAEPSAFAGLRLTGYPAQFQTKLNNSGHLNRWAKKWLDDLEIDMSRRLSRLSFATRVGPMLGLVGTLLPLGPALRGLASDDLASLAGNLEIAFTSTVFGLLIGGFAYAAGLVRRNWYDQDLSDLEFIADALRRTVERDGFASPSREHADA